MRIPLICSLFAVFTFTTSQTVFDRVEVPIRTAKCDHCPSGNIGCTPNGTEFHCECPKDKPRVDSGTTKLDDFFIPEDVKTSCAPALWKARARYGWVQALKKGIDTQRVKYEETQKLEHKPIQCQAYVDEKNERNENEKMLCVRGEFVYTPDTHAVYSCPTGDKQARLFVQAEGCIPAVSPFVPMDSNNRTYTFRLDRTWLEHRATFSTDDAHGKEGGLFSSFIIVDNVLKISGKRWRFSVDKFDVTGFYCIINDGAPVVQNPETYSTMTGYPIPNDMRSLYLLPTGIYPVQNCDECTKDKYRMQICLTNSTGIFCQCDPRYLHFTTTPTPTCENSHFLAYDKTSTTDAIEARMTSRSMEHTPYACQPYADEWNKQNSPTRHFECIEGEFTYHEHFLGLYTCDSNDKKGYLFVHTRKTDNSSCLNDRSLHHSIGAKSYYLVFEKTVEGDKAGFPYGSFYAYNDRIWERSTNCLVIGFYCIVERDKTPEITSYNPDIPSDLRVPLHKRPDYRIVANCTDCLPSQMCSFSLQVDNYTCWCDELSLSYYPIVYQPLQNPFRTDISEPFCKNTQFIGHKTYGTTFQNIMKDQHSLTTAQMLEPIKHEPEGCEKHANDTRLTEIYGRVTCFKGEFGRHPVYQGIYTWFLFIKTRARVGDGFDRTFIPSYGAKSFILYLELTLRRAEEKWPHFTSSNGQIYLFGDPVVGLYCLKRV